MACVGLALVAARSDDGDDAEVDGSPGVGPVAPATAPSPQRTPTSAVAVDTNTTDAATSNAITTVPPNVVVGAVPSPTLPPYTPPPDPSTATEAPTTNSPPPTTPPPSITSQRTPDSVNVLNDPTPSGRPSAEFAPSLAAAQRLADALATDDWNTARRLDPGLTAVSDEQLQDGYGSLDRATLLLVDGRRDGANQRLLLALIANERSGAQTTLYCVESTVSQTGEVAQRSATMLERLTGTITPEDLKAEPELIDLVRAQCAWD